MLNTMHTMDTSDTDIIDTMDTPDKDWIELQYFGYPWYRLDWPLILWRVDWISLIEMDLTFNTKDTPDRDWFHL